MIFRSWEPATIHVAGRDLRIKIKKLTVEEHAFYDRLLTRAFARESDRLLMVRRPGEEQERTATSALSSEQLDRLADQMKEIDALPVADAGPIALRALRVLVAQAQPTDRFVVPIEEVKARRWREMSPAQRDEYNRLRDDDLKAMSTFISEALRQFVRVDKGQIEFEDVDTGDVRPVINGEDFAHCFGATEGVLYSVGYMIHNKNQVSGDEKNGLGSRSASKTSSDRRDPTAIGDLSDTTAASAKNGGSAMTAAATPIAADPSGPTAN